MTPTYQNILQTLLEAVREAAIVIGDDMRVRVTNEQAAKAFGKTENGFEGRRLSELFRDLSLHEAFKRTAVEKVPSNVCLELIAEKTSVFEVHIEPLEIEGRNYALGIFYDRTKIEHLERVRQEFLSNISHELRTPLTSILAFVETLDDGGVDDKENNRRFLDIIRRNAERMHLLISDILELSLIESGQVFIEKKNVGLSGLVNNIFGDLAAASAAQRVRLFNEVAENGMVYADPDRLEQMLTNLIDNAIKFNKDGGTVSVRLSHNGSRSIIEVRDTGYGIPYGTETRIFERFYRGDRSRARAIGGTGLGLAIVKHISRLHGGDVSVASVPGEGTAFYIELPVADPGPEPKSK